MGTSVSVALPTDSDGFVSQECHACSKRFKAVFGEGSDRPIGHCPYCGHEEQNCWWTQEQASYLAAVAGQEIADSLLDDFAREVNRMSRPGDFLQVSAKVDRGPRPSPPAETDTSMMSVTFECCGERVKHDGSQARLYCIICGKLEMETRPREEEDSRGAVAPG